MPETANRYIKIITEVMFILLIICIFSFIENYIVNNHSHMPDCISFGNVSVTNNTGFDVAKYSISAFGGLLSIVALCMYVLGFMLSLVVIGTGNYREQFINAVKSYEYSGEANHEILEIMRRRCNNIHKNSRRLAMANRFIAYITIFVLLYIAVEAYRGCENIHILSNKFYALMVTYLLFLVLAIFVITFISTRIVDYGDLADIHYNTTKELINKIENGAEANTNAKTDTNTNTVVVVQYRRE